MKTLLRGGPLDGQIVETKRNQFGYGERKEIRRVGTEELLRVEDVYYANAYQEVRHPCKKRGTVRVYKFQSQTRKKP